MFWFFYYIIHSVNAYCSNWCLRFYGQIDEHSRRGVFPLGACVLDAVLFGLRFDEACQCRDHILLLQYSTFWRRCYNHVLFYTVRPQSSYSLPVLCCTLPERLRNNKFHIRVTCPFTPAWGGIVYIIIASYLWETVKTKFIMPNFLFSLVLTSNVNSCRHPTDFYTYFSNAQWHLSLNSTFYLSASYQTFSQCPMKFSLYYKQVDIHPQTFFLMQSLFPLRKSLLDS